jgi:hypothetical protein
VALIGVVAGIPSDFTGGLTNSRYHGLFIPAGLLWLAISLIIYHNQRVPALWLALFGLAGVGVGLHALTPGAWTVLALPCCGTGIYVFSRCAWQGPRNSFCAGMIKINLKRGRRNPVGRARLDCGVCTICFIFSALMAVFAL